MSGWPAIRAQRAGDAALRAATTVWLPRFQAELDLLPRPADRARQQAPGPDTVRVLILGNGLANAFGVRTQDLALPGALARALRERTGRGVEVDLDARRGMRVETVLARLDELRIWRYDAVVVTVGPTDAASVLPVERWREAVRELFTRLHASLGTGSTVLALSTVPMQRSPRGTDWIFEKVQTYGARLDEATDEVAQQFTGGDVGFLALRPVLEAAGEMQFSTVSAYAAVADRVAAVLAPRLPAPSATAARGPGEEEPRLAALLATGLLDARPSDRLVRLVRSARALFGVRGVALTLVADDHLRVVTHSGVETAEHPPRAGALIDRVLNHPGVFELGDVPPALQAAMPRLPTGPVRFYAGLAVEAPSGYALGALVLFDDEPRRTPSIDGTAMRDLVAGVQAELWDLAAVR